MVALSNVERVIVFPRSGYINRLQATASAAILAQDLDAQFLVCWEPQPAAGSPSASVFASDFRARTFITAADTAELIGGAIEALPRYLTQDDARNIIHLAGHDHGEQRYMVELGTMIEQAPAGTTLVITAGGHFHLTESGGSLAEESSRFAARRQAWYRQPIFHPDIEQAARAIAQTHSAFLGLHLRYTDRSLTAPPQRSIERALIMMRQQTGLASLFIASDTLDKQEEWVRRARALDFDPWTSDYPNIDRDDPRSAHPALIDWRVLGAARALTYFSESSFAHEAVVAAGSHNVSVGLKAHPIRIRAREIQRFLGSGLQWSGRHIRRVSG